jgi:hypothetical protein
VLVYADRAEELAGPAAYARWRRSLDRLFEDRPRHDAIVAGLIETGTLESALADAWCANDDAYEARLVPLRRVSEALGRAVADSWLGDEAGAELAIASAARDAADITRDAMPHRLRLKVPEGYAFYSLYPEAYVDAAIDWARHVRPSSVLCIGLRSIGTSLSGVVTGALRRLEPAVRSWTLRPRGHPFDRHVTCAPDLVAHFNLRDEFVVIVDEGPGLSGSSMAGAAALFSSIGVPDGRIILMPSSPPAIETFNSATARERWRRHAVVAPTFDSIRARLASEGVIPDDAVDVSAGAWRSYLPHGEEMAAHPQHERRKYVIDRGRRSISRFAGLGRYGEETRKRAERLAGGGWTAAPTAPRWGFLETSFVEATPMRAVDLSPAFVRHAARYVAWLRRSASAIAAADMAPLVAMLDVNAREALGDASADVVDDLSRQSCTFAEPITIVDGRMQPHEWLASPGATPRWIKVDALDHGRDHFFPGGTDAAWDVAGFIVEWGLDEACRDLFIEEYGASGGDRGISHRLSFFIAAYAAFRCGYCSMAAQSLVAIEEAQRFEALSLRYSQALAATLAASVR